MLRRVHNLCISTADWWIRRNPTYLLSAVCIAVGARLYLVSPSDRAGDLGVILMTLGFVQLYEWAVAAVLIVLHAWRRSPEDQPSLLLVAALFWTGPLAATTEMTARDPKLGLLLGMGVCLIAISELYAVARALKLRFSVCGIALACGCVLLVAVAPWWLYVPEDGPRTDELYMYLAWWLLAGLTLAGLGVGGMRSPAHGTGFEERGRNRQRVVEYVFLGIVVVVSAAHLYGMNYSLFTHARLFYASPLIVALTLVLFHQLPVDGVWSRRITYAVTFLPLLAILLTKQPFHELVPLDLIPERLGDATTPVLVFAAVTWWYGYARHRWVPMLHAGSAAVAWAIWRIVRFGAEGPVMAELPAVSMEPDRDLIAMGLYAIAVYLLGLAVVRRSRLEAVAGLVAQQAAATMLLWDRTLVPHADLMILLVLGGWSWLVAFCLLERRVAARLVLLPIAFLMVVTWGFDFTEPLMWWARSHAIVMAPAVFVLGWLCAWYRYRVVAAGVLGGHVTFYLTRHVLAGEHPLGAAAMLAGFALLAIGWAISWNKQALVRRRLNDAGDAEIPLAST